MNSRRNKNKKINARAPAPQQTLFGRIYSIQIQTNIQQYLFLCSSSNKRAQKLLKKRVWQKKYRNTAFGVVKITNIYRMDTLAMGIFVAYNGNGEFLVKSPMFFWFNLYGVFFFLFRNCRLKETFRKFSKDYPRDSNNKTK